MEIEHKLAHLVPHWIEHNVSHAEQFREWAERARGAGLAKAATHLEAAVSLMKAAGDELQQVQMGLKHAENGHD